MLKLTFELVELSPSMNLVIVNAPFTNCPTKVVPRLRVSSRSLSFATRRNIFSEEVV